jgi:hypothetical protein
MKIMGERFKKSAEDVKLSGKRTVIGRNSGEPQWSTEGAS